MAQIATLQKHMELNCSPNKFFDFFRNKMNSLVTMFPQHITSFQLLQGVDYSVGSVKLWKYVLFGTPMTVKAKIEEIDDENKSITFGVLDGDMMQLYKSFMVKIQADNGGVKWCFWYEKARQEAPSPDAYVDFATTITKGLDTYLLKS